MNGGLLVTDYPEIVRVLPGAHLPHGMIHRDVEAILIYSVLTAHPSVGPSALPLRFFLLATLDLILDEVEVALKLFDHLFALPQLLQGVISQMYGLLDSPHFQGSDVERVIVLG